MNLTNGTDIAYIKPVARYEYLVGPEPPQIQSAQLDAPYASFFWPTLWWAGVGLASAGRSLWRRFNSHLHQPATHLLNQIVADSLHTEAAQ